MSAKSYIIRGRVVLRRGQQVERHDEGWRYLNDNVMVGGRRQAEVLTEKDAPNRLASCRSKYPTWEFELIPNG